MPSALFFSLSEPLLHFLHRVAVISNLAPQDIQIFIWSLAFWAICFFSGSAIGMKVLSEGSINAYWLFIFPASRIAISPGLLATGILAFANIVILDSAEP